MNIYLQTLTETGQIIVPIFFLLSCGYLLRRRKIIDQQFVDQSSKLVFNIALPLLIFLNVSNVDLSKIINTEKLLFTGLATVIAGVVFFIIARKWVTAAEDQGVFAQGCFRSNFAIIGLAIIDNTYGATGVALASLLLSITMPLYNLMSIVFLTVPLKGDMSPGALIKSVISNPLILAVITALPFSYFEWTLPTILATTGDYFSNLTLPLALLAIGASLDAKYLRHSSTVAIHASLIKIVWQPLVVTVAAFFLGFNQIELVVIFILFGCPAAASGFVMVKNIGGNATLAANIVALSTLLSMITLGTGIFVLKLIYA